LLQLVFSDEVAESRRQVDKSFANTVAEAVDEATQDQSHKGKSEIPKLYSRC